MWLACSVAACLQDSVAFKAFGKETIMTTGAEHYEASSSTGRQPQVGGSNECSRARATKDQPVLPAVAAKAAVLDFAMKDSTCRSMHGGRLCVFF